MKDHFNRISEFDITTGKLTLLAIGLWLFMSSCHGWGRRHLGSKRSFNIPTSFQKFSGGTPVCDVRKGPPEFGKNTIFGICVK